MVSGAPESESGRSYRIIRPLGEMFHCQVHLAEWSGVEGFVKQLTIWQVRPELCTDKKIRQILLDGLKGAAALSASAAAQILDVWWEHNQITVAAEHVSGLSLAQTMELAARRGERLPVDVVLQALLEVVHALEQAHDPETRAGAVYHGDLRPDCILFGYEGAVKVTGFGFARFLPLASLDGAWCTWRGRCYQPPERLLGVRAGPETDIHAFGAILLEAVTGLVPYGVTQHEQLVRALQSGASVIPPDRVGEVPEDLLPIISRACATRPEDRYPSMMELGADLYRVMIERRRASGRPPMRLRELLSTLESPEERLARVQSPAAAEAPSPKAQLLEEPKPPSEGLPQLVTTPTRPLVGRAEVLRDIGRALAGLKAGRGQALLLTGEDGMGKSRLLTEVALRLASSRRELAWVQVGCCSRDRAQRYSTVLRLIASTVGLRPDEPLSSLAKQVDRLRAFGLEDATLEAIRGVLGEGRPPEPAHLVGQMSQAVIQCLSSLSWEQTTIVAWDDVQYTDPASMVCLGELLARLATIPVVVLMTGPRNFRLPFSPDTLQVITLGPLTTTECETLALQCAGDAERVEPRLLQALVRRSGGNPSLVEQLTDLLIESGQVFVEGKILALRDRSASTIPGLSEGVRARFRTLSPEAAAMSVAAALASPAINEQVLARATGLSPKVVRATLDELVERRVLRARRQGLVFPHERLRLATLDAAGEDYVNAYRPAVARALLDVSGQGDEGWRDHAASLLVEAGDRAGAAATLVEAAELKEKRGDLAGAAEQYSRALELARGTDVFGPTETLRISLKAGNAALHGLRLELGERALDQAIALAEAQDDSSAGARARVLLCRLLAREGRLKEAMDVVQEAIPLAEQTGDPIVLCQVYNAIAESYQQWGEYGPDFDYIEPALRLASESGDLLQLGRSLQLAVSHAAGVGKYERTEELLRRARAIARTSKDPLLICQLIRAEALVAVFSGDPEAGLRRSLAGLEQAHRHGLREMEVIFLHNAGDAHLRLGRYQEALYYFNESLRRSEAARFDRLSEINTMYVGFLEAVYLRTPGGFEKIQTATENARQAGRIWNVTQGHQLMGRVLLDLGDAPSAVTQLEEALRLAEASGVAFFVEEATRWLQQARQLAGA